MPKGFLQGLVLCFFLLCFFWFSSSFLVFRLGSFHRLQCLEKNQKPKEPKKTKSWEKCCAQGLPPGDWFFGPPKGFLQGIVFLVSLFFLASLVFWCSSSFSSF